MSEFDEVIGMLRAFYEQNPNILEIYNRKFDNVLRVLNTIFDLDIFAGLDIIVDSTPEIINKFCDVVLRNSARFSYNDVFGYLIEALINIGELNKIKPILKYTDINEIGLCTNRGYITVLFYLVNNHNKFKTGGLSECIKFFLMNGADPTLMYVEYNRKYNAQDLAKEFGLSDEIISLLEPVPYPDVKVAQ